MKDSQINLQKLFIWERRETFFHFPPNLKVSVSSLKPNVWFLQLATAFHFKCHIVLTLPHEITPKYFLRFNNNLCFIIKTIFFFLTLQYLLWLDSTFSQNFYKESGFIHKILKGECSKKLFGLFFVNLPFRGFLKNIYVAYHIKYFLTLNTLFWVKK